MKRRLNVNPLKTVIPIQFFHNSKDQFWNASETTKNQEIFMCKWVKNGPISSVDFVASPGFTVYVIDDSNLIF